MRLAQALAFSLAFVAVPAGVSGVLAQQQPVAPAAPAVSAAPAVPALPQPVESHVKAARELLVISGITRSFAGIMPQAVVQVQQTFSRQRPELAKQIEDTLLGLRAEYDVKNEELFNAMAVQYARRLSEAEVLQLNAFFKSPVGQKYTEAQPLLLDELFADIDRWGRSFSDFVILRLREEMAKKGQVL